MEYTIQISSTNYSGFTASVNFTGTTGNTIDLGSKLIPFEINSENPYGTYELYFSSYNKTCSFEIPDPTPTPSNSPTPSVTPTYTPTPTTTPTNTPTPSITPSVTPSQGLPPFTGYGFNLVDAPYAPPSSGNTLFTNFGSGGVVGITNPNTFVTNGVYWSYIDNTGTDRSIFFSGLTTGNNLISFTHNSNTVIYSANSNSFFFDNDNLNVFYNPFLEPYNLVLIQSSSSNFNIGEEVQINFSGV